MIRVVVCSHGNLAEELVRTAGMVCGPLEGVRAVCLPPGRSVEAFRREVEEAVRECGDDPVVLLTDMFGGSAFMAAAAWVDGDRRILVSGANLPILLEIAFSRLGTPWEELRDSLRGGLERYVRFYGGAG